MKHTGRADEKLNAPSKDSTVGHTRKDCEIPKSMTEVLAQYDAQVKEIYAERRLQRKLYEPITDS